MAVDIVYAMDAKVLPYIIGFYRARRCARQASLSIVLPYIIGFYPLTVSEVNRNNVPMTRLTIC